MSNRDDFTKQTVETLAKRVCYQCSNPFCNQPTIGPHSNPLKTTLVGVAAHITAASPNGPRYDSSISPDDRRHIENGIWLCVNCSTLIDKDEQSYPKTLLVKWKKDAEKQALGKITGENTTKLKPIIEADLIWSSGGRTTGGYSDENFENGKRHVIVGQDYIMFYDINWRYNLILMNNSSLPAFNISIEQIEGDQKLTIDKLPKINNLLPFQNLELKAKLQQFFKGYHYDADKLINMDIPPILKDVKLNIKYYDESRNEYHTIVDFTSGELENQI